MRFLAALALAGAAMAQATHPVTTFDVTWTNMTGQGSPVLASRVFMPNCKLAADDVVLPSAPSTASAQSAAMGAVGMPPRGWPTIVFLHGFGLQGRQYGRLLTSIARCGFVVIAPDTAVYDYVNLTCDAIANLDAARVASGDPASPLHGAIDPGRIGVAGHSMGAACMALAMPSNPGFRCAYAFAPVSPFGFLPALIDVPVGVVVGGGDVVTSWQQHAQPFYAQSTPVSGVKMIHLLAASSTHLSVAGLAGATPDFARAADICTGFFQHFLGVDDGGMERCLGPAVFADPVVASHEQTVVQARIWSSSPLRVGQTSRMSVAAAPGISVILVADQLVAGLPTPLGMLMLDPATAFTWAVGMDPRGRRMDAPLAVPSTATLVGLSLAMQPLAPTAAAPFGFGSATGLVVVR